MSLGWGIGILLLLMILSAFFSGSETAITSMGKGRLEFLIKEHKRKGKALKALIDEPNDLITAIVIGNNFVNIMAASMATVLSIQLLYSKLKLLNQTEAGLVATIVMTISLLVMGEITPKNLAKNNAERLTLACVNIIFLLSRILKPFIAAFKWISESMIKIMPSSYHGKEQPQASEEQIEYLIGISEERGLLDEEEGEMIRRIFAYDDMAARQVMVPRPDVKAIEVNTPLKDVKEIVTKDGHSRFPVYEDNRDNVMGVLYAKDLLRAKDNEKLTDIIRPAYYTSTTKPINDLLRDFQRDKQHMAIVMDEYGGMAGIVTLEDIMEEIVGEIEDEYDKPEQPIKKIAANQFIVDGNTEVDLLNEELNLELPLDEGVTVSGLLLHRFEDIPEEGESVKIDTVLITVEDASEREILKVKLELLPTSSEAEEAETAS